MRFFITRVRDWYVRFERPISSISLISGFLFDAITLKRVDLFWENFWVVIHLAIVAICIVLINREENELMDKKDLPANSEKNLSRTHFWLINILQFFFGGLLSAFLVFYFRSATLSVAWPFLLLLVFAFVANERLKRHYERLTFQISLFFLSLFSFAIFFIPVFFHKTGPVVFLISGFVSLLVLWLFLVGLGFFTKEKFKKGKKMLIFSVSIIFLTINILYFLNLIPPLPISLKDGGIYHSILRNASGNYIVQSEDAGWLRYFALHEDFHALANDSVYAYTAIFSPASFNTDIIHEWQEYDKNTGKWITVNRISMTAVGGRDGGYRTYSIKNNITPGVWRVNVETARGQAIGRLRFNVIGVGEEPTLKTDIKD